MANQNRAMYELLYVVNTVLNDDQVDDICDRVAAYIRDNDGEVIEEERWGSRRMAYPIEKKRNGYYGLVYFRSNPDFLARLDRSLRINDDILRHLVLRYDAKMERFFERRKSEAAEAAKQKAAEEAKAAEEPKAAADEPKAAADEPKAAADEPKAAADEPKAAADEPKAAADEPKPAATDEPTAEATESET